MKEISEIDGEEIEGGEIGHKVGGDDVVEWGGGDCAGGCRRIGEDMVWGSAA